MLRLYIVLFLHQTTTVKQSLINVRALYIVLFLHQTTTLQVIRKFRRMLYIVLFLHQTTTTWSRLTCDLRCISYYSYIKPQQTRRTCRFDCVVYRTIPTSNHNSLMIVANTSKVVYRTIPTSNHNSSPKSGFLLIVVYRTIPTSNHNFYNIVIFFAAVVYRTIPTSNHNRCTQEWKNIFVVYRTIPTSNHNGDDIVYIYHMLYIVLFLHQTTTYNVDIADNQHITITFINKK